MSELFWDDSSRFIFESGIDKCVLYRPELPPVVWSGVTKVTTSDEITNDFKYLDKTKYQVKGKVSDFSGVIEAYSYPLEFGDYQSGKLFNLSYRTQVFDNRGKEIGYKTHLLYNLIAVPDNRVYTSLNGEDDVSTLAWNLSSIPEIFEAGRKTSHLIIDSTKAYSWATDELNHILYGSYINDPYFPAVQQVVDLFENASVLKVTDLGDGSFTVEGPDYAISSFEDGSFEIDWPSALYISEDTYTIESL